jgi:hypothetical protein
MALFPLGILSAAGAGGVPQTYELIQTQILGSTQSAITFSSLGGFSSTYRHLQIRFVARDSLADTGQNISLKLNAATSTYRSHRLIGDGSTVSTDSSTSMNIALSQSNSDTANSFGVTVLDLLDAFSSTKNTTVRSLTGTGGSSFRRIMFRSGAWFTTDSITSIELAVASGGFVSGSRFSLYGIRG